MSGIYVNIDFCNLFLDFEAQNGRKALPHLPMNEEGLRQEIDYYAVPGVKAILFNLNAMRAMFDSRTFDPVWKDVEFRAGKPWFHGKPVGTSMHHSQEQMVMLCRELYRNVRDPQKFRYDYCHRKNVAMYISMRMNDVHWVSEPGLVNHADLWREHPEFRRAGFKARYTDWFSQCFDYAKPEVYEHHIALAREYFDRFDMDGFELDWMRSPLFFRPGAEEQGRAVLTRFMEEVRTLVTQTEKRRGHKIRILARVHSRPEEALSAGLDVVRWAKNGLIDTVIPSPYFVSNDTDMPVELWKMLLPETVELSPCIDCQYAASLRTPATPELDAGTASVCYYRGADSIYLYNHMLRFPPYGLNNTELQRRTYTILADRRKAEKAPRRHAATLHENFVEGKCSTPPFPPEIPPESCTPVKIDAGGGTSGRKAQLFIASAAGKLPAGLEVYLNGEKCSCAPEQKPYPDTTDIYLADGVAPLAGKFFFDVPENVLHDGENQVDLLNAGDAPFPLAWVEIAVC